MKEKVDCLKCKHYLVTWDARYPRGCKLFGFKGSIMPSIMVYKSTGAMCQNYMRRQMQSSNT